MYFNMHYHCFTARDLCTSSYSQNKLLFPEKKIIVGMHYVVLGVGMEFLNNKAESTALRISCVAV